MRIQLRAGLAADSRARSAAGSRSPSARLMRTGWRHAIGMPAYVAPGGPLGSMSDDGAKPPEKRIGVSDLHLSGKGVIPLIWIKAGVSGLIALFGWSSSKESCMPRKTDNLLPNARDVQRQATAKAAKNAEDFVRVLAEAELEKRALTERLGTASAVSEDDKIKLTSAIIRRAAQSGLGEVQLYRFSDSLCTDGGLAISRNAAGWETTLRGVPRDIYDIWANYMRPRGYQIRYIVNKLLGSLPENVSIVVSWDD